ncbi:MAG: hypothetical protein RIG68_00935 [Imperialibacter sp.]|uniref:hypothetical protein n=1 Tax=Imperialibacter sp. TaxID=2038411 RepID=UPI0032EE2969
MEEANSLLEVYKQKLSDIKNPSHDIHQKFEMLSTLTEDLLKSHDNLMMYCNTLSNAQIAMAEANKELSETVVSILQYINKQRQ